MESLNELILKADSGDLEAGVKLAAHYIEKDGVEIPEGALDKIKGYLSAAVDAGISRAMTIVGDMYKSGKGVEVNYDKAEFWYDMAEKNGDRDAQSKMPERPEYLDEYMRRFHQCKKAAEMDDIQALMQLGDMYLDGTYMDRKPEEAYKSYSRAYELASADNMQKVFPEICMKVGYCYAKGTGTDYNMTKAAEFFGAAVKAYSIQSYYGEADKKHIDEANEALDEALKTVSSKCYGGK